MANPLRSARILARPVTAADTPAVVGIYEGNRDLLVLLDREHDPEVLARRFVQGLNLPQGSPPAGLRNYLLCDVQTGRPTGLLSLYIGYPSRDVAYIGELFLHPGRQGVGLGREVCLCLEQALRSGPAKTMRVGVGLKNWNALRFWVKLGFTEITGMSGDRHFRPDGHAFLELQKTLGQP
jgi:ribosomal protein S18 acetylase RimI-like enzyme